MKVILTGSTGYIGKEVLHQCLENPAITSLIALSRRELPGSTPNPKLTVVIIEDFKSYPGPVLEQLKGAEACIW
jgi:nucleoside-diphosphate-sugar epimerase